MRVRVRLRYHADTGEVEVFEVESLQTGPLLADSEALHDRVAADVARVVENNSLIEEVWHSVPRLSPTTLRSAEEVSERQLKREADG
jgi:FtsH ternary system-associated peptide